MTKIFNFNHRLLEKFHAFWNLKNSRTFSSSLLEILDLFILIWFFLSISRLRWWTCVLLPHTIILVKCLTEFFALHPMVIVRHYFFMKCLPLKPLTFTVSWLQHAHQFHAFVGQVNMTTELVWGLLDAKDKHENKLTYISSIDLI